MPLNNPCLIIAESARALAASANMAGIPCHVIDRFNDQDTATFCLSRLRVNALEREEVTAALRPFRETPLAGVVVGGGLEHIPAVLENITETWPLLGNPPAVVNECKAPGRFIALLDELEIPHPEISLYDRKYHGDWLQKRIGASGGGHIIPYRNGQPLRAGYYLQQKITGRSFSAVFLANGQRAELFGISHTWCRDSDMGDFRYRGAIGLSGLEPVSSTAFNKLVSRLTGKLQLRGLCGIDVIITDSGQLYLLEINPRPTATFSLHERQNSLFLAHVMACKGEMTTPEKISSYRAHEVLYSEGNDTFPEVHWPDWVTDRPHTGERLSPGEPLCTVHAEAGSLVAVRRLLAKRVTYLLRETGMRRLAA